MPGPVSSVSESCQERTGFLFAHDCARPVSLRCMSCSKAICEEHAHGTGTGRLCTGCYRVQDPPPELFAASHHQDPGPFGRVGWDEPHPDPDDFTEADGASLRGPEEEPLFEKDMQGS